MVSVKRQEPREICFTVGINPYTPASVLAEFGNTKVHITASILEEVPPFLKGKGQGWVSAEYSMLPAATNPRGRRERVNLSGRTQEIQRLIGRSLRSITDLKLLGERTIMIDCDVLVADGGTRTTSISGAYIALALATRKLLLDKVLLKSPIKVPVAALSVGISQDKEVVVDLNYEEDSSCDTDMNIVMTKDGRFVEIQGTAEKDPFSSAELESLLGSAKAALKVVFEKQEEALKC